MSTNLAVVVDPDAPGRLVIRPVPEPTADRSEALVRVHAISLNFAVQLVRLAGAHVPRACG